MPRLSRQESRNITVDKLRRAAIEEFAINGFAGAAIDRITENAGYSRGAFYANYASKDEILLDILAQEHIHELDRWRALLDHAADLDTICNGIADTLAHYIGNTSQGMFIAEVQLHARRNPEFAEKYRTHMRQVHGTLSELLAASFRKAGRHPPADIEDIAGLMRGLVVGLVLDIGLDDLLSPADSAAQQLNVWLRSVIAQGEPVNS